MHLNTNPLGSSHPISAIIIDRSRQNIEYLKQNIEQHCPQIQICGATTVFNEGLDLILREIPCLLFIEVAIPEISNLAYTNGSFFPACQTIFTSSCAGKELEAFRYQGSGFLKTPVQAENLVIAVKQATIKIQAARKASQGKWLRKKGNPSLPPGELIGIPTIEGFEFIPIDHLIRCEGMQKYTQLITKERSDIISAQNIGEFIKLLSPFHFFSPHKSHLINLVHVKKYFKEGTIEMTDRSYVPVAKRRKTEFLDFMLLLR